MTRAALTFDIEDWHELVSRRLGANRPPSSHVERDTRRILDMLDGARVRGTFFVMGSVANTYPSLVKEIARRGHEIGRNSYAHQLISHLDEDAFVADISRSRAQLQDLTSQPVLGFRAPEFSVGRLGHWCFDALAQQGFAYDSSVFPVTGARYGIPEAPHVPFRLATKHGSLTEFPLATWQVGGRRLPVAGGTYFRFLPAAVLRRALHAGGAPVLPVLYFHPYEFHRGLLWVNQVDLRARLRPAGLAIHLLHNLATGAVAARLSTLLNEFTFEPLGDTLHREHPEHANAG